MPPPDVLLKILGQFLDVGIVGAVAILALWWGWSCNKEARSLHKQLRLQEKQNAIERLQLQKESYERVIAYQTEQTQRYANVVREMKETVLMLAQSVQYEEAAPALEPGPLEEE